MKTYYKEENGNRVWLSNILIVDDKQIINPTEEQILEAGYIEYIEEVPEIPNTQLLENIRNGKLLQLESYDNSNTINVCYIVYQGQTLEYWADRHERDSLKSAINDCITLGRETYRLDLRNLQISLEIKCTDLLQMLAQLEVYAIDCYNKTTDHEYAIKALTTQDEIIAYNFMQGYPNKLTFEL